MRPDLHRAKELCFICLIAHRSIQIYAKHWEGNHYSASEQQLFALPEDGEFQRA